MVPEVILQAKARQSQYAVYCQGLGMQAGGHFSLFIAKNVSLFLWTKLNESHSKICEKYKTSQKLNEFKHNESWGGGIWSDAGGNDKQWINFAWPKYGIKLYLDPLSEN